MPPSSVNIPPLLLVSAPTKVPATSSVDLLSMVVAVSTSPPVTLTVPLLVSVVVVRFPAVASVPLFAMLPTCPEIVAVLRLSSAPVIVPVPVSVPPDATVTAPLCWPSSCAVPSIVRAPAVLPSLRNFVSEEMSSWPVCAPVKWTVPFPATCSVPERVAPTLSVRSVPTFRIQLSTLVPI